MKDKLRGVWLVVVLLMLCGGYVTVRVSLGILEREFPLPFLGAVGGLFTLGAVVAKVRDRRALRRISAWEATAGWTAIPTSQDWPWQPLVRDPGQVTVHRAWTAQVEGFPVTAGEISWDDNAFDGAVTGWKGRGVFVIVRLPLPSEPMALRRPHRTIGDSHRLDLPAVHEAFEAGRIPPWTVRGEELFTFETVEGRFTPKSVERSVQRALLAVRLLDLGPDSCNGPQSAERDVIPDTAGEPLTADWHPDPGTLPSTSRDIDLPTMEPVPTRQSPPALTLDAPSG